MSEYLQNTGTQVGAVRAFLEHLSMGFGYNAYSTDASIRADDQILRNRACQLLNEGKQALQMRAQDWKRLHLTCTREHPVPSPQDIARGKEMDATIQSLSVLETQIHNAAIPQDSPTWNRHRDSRLFLPQLLDADGALLQTVANLRDLCTATDTTISTFADAIREVESAWKARQSVFSGFFSTN